MNGTPTVFYSWQSDCPSAFNRSFIEKALKIAIQRLNSDSDLQPALRGELAVDKDTQGVSGSPPIAQTILEKIEHCSAFVADLTFCGHSLPTAIKPDKAIRLFPNPNVLIEYGYALRCHGHQRTIGIMNTAFGECSERTLPFDLKHLRWPVLYHLDESSKINKNETLESLAKNLTNALRSLISDSAPSALKTTPFLSVKPIANDVAIFSEDPEEVAPERRYFEESAKLIFPNEGRCYLRLYPTHAVNPIMTELEALEFATQGQLRPMGLHLSGWEHQRNRFGACSVNIERSKLFHFTQLFLSKELWGVDAFAVNATGCREFTQGRTNGYIASDYVEMMFARTLQSYLTFSRTTLELGGELKIEAGLTNIKNYPIAYGNIMDGKILQDNITWSALIKPKDDDIAGILEPFLSYMWSVCGVKRPAAVQEKLERFCGSR